MTYNPWIWNMVSWWLLQNRGGWLTVEGQYSVLHWTWMQAQCVTHRYWMHLCNIIIYSPLLHEYCPSVSIVQANEHERLKHHAMLKGLKGAKASIIFMKSLWLSQVRPNLTDYSSFLTEKRNFGCYTEWWSNLLFFYLLYHWFLVIGIYTGGISDWDNKCQGTWQSRPHCSLIIINACLGDFFSIQSWLNRWDYIREITYEMISSQIPLFSILHNSVKDAANGCE